MGWIYLDDGFPEHPKILAAGVDRYRSHYASCPDAGEWRKRK